MRRHDLVSSFVLFCFGLFIVLYSSVTINIGTLRRPGLGFLPFLSGLIICTYSVVIFLQAFLKKPEKDENIWSGVKFRSLIQVVLIILFYPFLLNLLGSITSFFLLLIVIMRYAGSQTWGTSVLWAGVSSIAAYLLFDMWLKIQFPIGIMGF